MITEIDAGPGAKLPSADYSQIELRWLAHVAEERLIARNVKLLTKGDDSEVTCETHGVTMRWGDLDPITQLAVLAGIDVDGDQCIMSKI